MKILCSESGLKVLISDDEAIAFIVRDEGEFQEWDLGGLQFEVRWEGLTQSSRRKWGHAGGEGLGGYIGASHGADGYHIGTPAFAASLPFVRVVLDLLADQAEHAALKTSLEG